MTDTEYVTYRGKSVDAMSREELIEAVKFLLHKHTDMLASHNKDWGYINKAIDARRTP